MLAFYYLGYEAECWPFITWARRPNIDFLLPGPNIDPLIYSTWTRRPNIDPLVYSTWARRPNINPLVYRTWARRPNLTSLRQTAWSSRLQSHPGMFSRKVYKRTYLILVMGLVILQGFFICRGVLQYMYKDYSFGYY